MRKMSSDRQSLICVMLALAVFGLAGGSHKAVVSYNDGISYLAATGHQKAYYRDGSAGQWAPASRWQAFWQPDDFPAFRRVASELARYDRHPPLYFWLLHLLVNILGNDLFWATLLNLVLLSIGVPLLCGACIRLGCSPRSALLAACAWALSGATVAIAFQARQYALLSLCVIAFFRTFVGFTREPSALSVLGLTMIAAAGLLTQYHFVLVLGAAGLYTLFLFARSRPMSVVAFAASSLVAFAALPLLHPGFLRAIKEVDARSAGFGLSDVPLRAGRFAEGLAAMLVPADLAWVGAVAVVAGLCVLAYRRYRRPVPTSRRPPGSQLAWFLGGVTIILAWLLYSSGQTPYQATGSPYIAVATPMLYAGMACWLDGRRSSWSEPRWRRVAIAIAIYFTLYGGFETGKYIADQRLVGLRSVRLPAGPVVIDSANRGYIPAILWRADPEALVFVARNQESLLEHWPEGLATLDDLIYVNAHGSPDSVLERLRASGFEVRRSGELIPRSGKPQQLSRRGGRVFRLRRASVGSVDDD